MVTTEVDLLTDTCRIWVSAGAPDILAESVEIDPGSLSIIMDNSALLSVEVLPLDTDNKTVSWLSSDPSIASVDANGEVYGASIGSAWVKARTTDGSQLEDSIRVQVSPLPNTLDCGLIPSYQETDTLFSVEVKYTLGEQKDIAVIFIKRGVALPWTAEGQVTVDPGAGTLTVDVRARNIESGEVVFPDPGSYIIESYIRDVGGDASTNSTKCFKSVSLLERSGVLVEEAIPDAPRIHPNPAGDILHISGTGDVELMTEYSLQGVKYLEYAGNGSDSYDISSLPEGAWVLVVTGKDSRWKHLIVKQK